MRARLLRIARAAREYVRDLIHDDGRTSSTTILALIGLLCLLASSLGLTLAYRSQAQRFQRAYYQQCIDRAAYDQSSQRVRAKSRTYYEHQIINEQRNRFIDDDLRARRIADAREMVAALTDTLGRTVRDDCERYKS